jgi:electron transfer flavoprotein-quinone oxidoreductase
MDKYDAIVVGTGPAGSACAYTMAKEGLNVLVIERGSYPGAKNMWGGAFFGPQMNQLFPGFWEEAPVERFVHRHVISFLTGEDSLAVDFKTAGHEDRSKQSFIMLRAKFDRWMAEKVDAAGVIVASGLAVDDLVMEGGAVAGVKVGDEDFLSDVVILADGVNSLLALKRGLRKPFHADDMKQGVKEVIRLPREVIEDRFNLRDGEGAIMEFLGDCTGGLPGGGFIYTNRDSLSVGVVVQLGELVKNQTKASDLIERFKNHPAVAPLIKGGETIEYSAHLIPVAGLKMVPKLCADGVMVVGDAAALVLGTGLILEGANLAIASGVAAAQTAAAAKQKNDFTSAALQQYERTLKEQFVLKDLATFSKAPEFLENERIYTTYPRLACDLSRKIFSSDGTPRDNTFKVLQRGLKERVSLWQLFSDAMKARKSI